MGGGGWLKSSTLCWLWWCVDICVVEVGQVGRFNCSLIGDGGYIMDAIRFRVLNIYPEQRFELIIQSLTVLISSSMPSWMRRKRDICDIISTS